jgi:hypothetical protein
VELVAVTHLNTRVTPTTLPDLATLWLFTLTVLILIVRYTRRWQTMRERTMLRTRVVISSSNYRQTYRIYFQCLKRSRTPSSNQVRSHNINSRLSHLSYCNWDKLSRAVQMSRWVRTCATSWNWKTKKNCFWDHLRVKQGATILQITMRTLTYRTFWEMGSRATGLTSKVSLKIR